MLAHIIWIDSKGNAVESLVVAELIICLLSFFFPLGDNARFFSENDVYNYSTMLLIEDKGMLMLGAREKVYALDLYNISQKRASVRTPFFVCLFFFNRLHPLYPF